MRTSRWTSGWAVIGSLFLLAACAPVAWGQNIQGTSNPQLNPQVGAVNYVEGQAAINGRALSSRSVGAVDLQAGQSLVTQSGKVEILLTPGVFLRVADHSTVTMVSPSLAPTEVELVSGRAMVEVNYIRKENDIRVDEHGASIKLSKKGLYDFDADDDQVRVFKGQAEVYAGNRKTTLLEGREAVLDAAKPKSKGFKTAQYQDDFYSWCRLRSEYVLQANAELQAEYGGADYGPGWYWNPWFDAWAFPYDWGWGYYSPFGFGGYGFYPYGGYGYGGYGFGYRGRGYPRPGFGGRGFGGGGFRRGGGFRGGGGFGGGFHGGGGFAGGHGR
jgi:FecR-like protein